MRMKFTKALRDLTINPRRTFLVIFALILGIWGVGTVLVSYFILTKDLNTNYQLTSPIHLIIHSENFENLDLEEFIRLPEVETAEFRDFSLHRIEVFPDEWIPVWLYGVEDFASSSIAKVFPEKGRKIPKKGSILIERDGKNVSNIEINSTPRLRIGNKIIKVPVSGICFDPAQAPATQDAMIYAYTDKKTYNQITGRPNNQRLVVRMNGVHSGKDVKNVSMTLLKKIESQNVNVASTEIPKFNEHPHQWQLNTILLIIGTIGFLAFVMGSVLVSQLIRAIMASQVRQIGILKAIGASRSQVFQIYIAMLLLLGIGAGIIAVPLAVKAGTAYANFVAGKLNFDILTTISVYFYIYLFSASLLLPILLSVSTLIKGTGTSVREALNDYGISNRGGRQLQILKKLKLPNTFILSIRNSLRNSKRLAVTITTMALGVAIFSAGFNVRQSLWELLSDLNNELRYDVQVVLNEEIPREEALRPFKSIENIEKVGLWVGGRGEIQSKVLSTKKGAGIIALPYDSELLKLKIVEGRWIEPSKKNEIVLNHKAWELYGNPILGSNINITIGDENILAKIVGIAEQIERSKIYMDLQHYDSLFNLEHHINSLLFVAENNEYEKVLDLKRAIENSIATSNLDVLYVMSQAERVKIIYDHLNIILSIIVFLSFLVLLVSAVGMASATGINIGERTREIGVMRAIGATPKKIYALFVNEGMIISFLSIVMGLILSYPLSQVATAFFGDLMLGEEAVLKYAFSPLGFWITLVVTILFGWMASRIPARYAVQIATSKALSYE